MTSAERNKKPKAKTYADALQKVIRCVVKGLKVWRNDKSTPMIVKSKALFNKTKALTDKSSAMICVFRIFILSLHLIRSGSYVGLLIIRKMKQRYAVIVLFALIIASSFTSLDSYRSTSRMVNEDMDRALALALEEQQSDVINQDTIRTFNSHLQIAELRGKATLAVDTRGQKFKAYAHCSEATIFSLSDQRPATILWVLTIGWGMFCIGSQGDRPPVRFKLSENE